MLFNSSFRYGSEAGIIEPPEHCQLVLGRCDVVFVHKNDSSKPCDDEHAIKLIRLYKKKKFRIRRKSVTLIS